MAGNDFGGTAELEIDKNNNLNVKNALFKEDTIISSKKYVKEHIDEIREWTNDKKEEFGQPHTHKYINKQLCGDYKLIICCDDMRERWNGYSYVDNQEGFHINEGGILMDYFEGCSGDTFEYCHKCGTKVKIIKNIKVYI